MILPHEIGKKREEKVPKQADIHTEIQQVTKAKSNRKERMADLINGVGPQVMQGLKKITYMTIYQMKYKFIVSEYFKEYVYNSFMVVGGSDKSLAQ